MNNGWMFTDIILPARVVEGAAPVTYAALTIYGTISALLLELVELQRGSKTPDLWARFDAEWIKGEIRVLGHLPNYHHYPVPRYGNNVLERALERLAAQGWDVVRTSSWPRCLRVEHSAMRVTRSGISWFSTVAGTYPDSECFERWPDGRPVELVPWSQRSDCAVVETGELPVAVLRQLAGR